MNLESIPGFNPQSENAVSRFDAKFINKYGLDSVFVRGLSDLWTVAMSRLLLANNLLEDGKPIALMSEQGAVETLSRLAKHSEMLKDALFQEPFGFAKVGAVRQAFEQSFGLGIYEQWIDAFERKDFDRCISITKLERQ